MKAILLVGLATAAVVLFAGLLSAFSLPGAADDIVTSLSDTEDTSSLDIATIQDASERLSMAYTSIVEDIASFQQYPSPGRAESRRQTFVDYAQIAADIYKGLNQDLQDRLNSLTGQSDGANSQ